jgi:hypothetical protein
MTPEELARLEVLEELTKQNTVAIVANGEVLKHMADSMTLANVLLTVTGTLCAEIAADAANPHERLEEILASFETGVGQVLADQPEKPALGQRVLKQIDMLREIAESTLQDRLPE